MLHAVCVCVCAKLSPVQTDILCWKFVKENCAVSEGHCAINATTLQHCSRLWPTLLNGDQCETSVCVAVNVVLY